MPTIYVARSPLLGKWASDVGLSRHVYKIGIVEGDKRSIEAKWCGFDDWKIVKTRSYDRVIEEPRIFERLSIKNKMLEPRLYPKIRGVFGIFKIPPAHVENYLVLTRALAGGALDDVKLQPGDFAEYMLHVAGGAFASEEVLKDVE